MSRIANVCIASVANSKCLHSKCRAADNAVSSLDALGRAIGPTYAAVDVHVVVVVVLSFSPLQDQKEGGERQQRTVVAVASLGAAASCHR